MNESEHLAQIEEIVKRIEAIYYDPWKDGERSVLIESLYDAGHIDWLIDQIKRHKAN